MKKLKCKKQYGEWWYIKYIEEDMEAPLYELYNSHGEYVSTFGSYADMKYYVMTGIII